MQADRIRCGPESLKPVYSRVERTGEDFMGHFSANFKVHIIQQSDDEIVFDLVGVDAPVANALRRILLSEVPSVAIENVYIMQNTSIIQDEVLAHRLGLVPLRVDPRQMEAVAPGDEPTDLNTVVYKLSVRGTAEASRYTKEEVAALEASSDDAEGRYTKVYSRDLVWQPQGGQEERFSAGRADPVHGDILLAKLAPGQSIELEAHAVKSVGKDHAKFSPVATASYRLLPAVALSEEAPFEDDEARALVAACPLGVFDIEDTVGAGGEKRARARVARPRDCNLCRECIRRPEWVDRVQLERVADHFIFSVESTGAMPAADLVRQALAILASKARALSSALDSALASDTGGVMPAAAAAKHTIAAMTLEPDDLS